MTSSLVRELDGMQTALDHERIGRMAKIADNPFAIQIARFGRATAFASGTIATAYYNKVDGLGIAELPLLEDIGRFFVGAEAATCCIGILPGDLNVELADRLSAYGLRQVGFHAGYYGIPELQDVAAPANVRVRAVESSDDLTTYLTTFHAGWEMRAETLGLYLETMRFWSDVPGWHLLLAEIDGIARGVGLMTSAGRTGYLAIATTLPAFRNRGCEQALVHHAIGRAKALGCEVVCGQCEVDSPSAHNFQRFGMRLAYHKAMWLLRDSGPPRADLDSLY